MNAAKVPPDPTDAQRVRLAAASDTPLEVRLALAADPCVTVRAAAAMNAASLPAADLHLVHDSDVCVRTLLSRRLTGLLHGLASERQERMRAHILATLDVLVQDEAVRVRASIADAIKALPDAPRDLILRLAADMEMPVCQPIIHLSPVLTPRDLIGLVLNPPAECTARAVAGRPDLDADTADTVAASDDAVAISVLLSNPTAAVREATVDALVTRSSTQEAWHGPLVRHPALSPASAQALSQFVTRTLLGELARRADLPTELTDELSRQLESGAAEDPRRPAREPLLEEAMATARRMDDEGELNERVLHDVITRGEVRLAAALLAVAAEVPIEAVDRAVTLRNAKALVSLVWKAGFSMYVALPLQSLLANLVPSAVLGMGPGHAFPLAAEEMRWQIECLTRTVR